VLAVPMVLQWPSLGVPLWSVVRLTRFRRLYYVDLLADHVNHSVISDLSSAVQLACFPDNGSCSNHLLAFPSVHWEQLVKAIEGTLYHGTYTSVQHSDTPKECPW